MKLELNAVRAKIARSQEHAQAINSEVRAWMDRKPYGLTQHVNPDSTRYSLVLRENEPAPFQRWTLMFSDFLNNLRSALDYLVYAIAVSDSGVDPPPGSDKLMFPITDCRIKFDDAVRRGRLGDIAQPVRTAIELLQPYNRPHPEFPPLLAILRDLNNSDKHKLPNLAYGAFAQGELRLQGEHPADGRDFRPIPNRGKLKDGAEVVAMVCDRPTPNMQWGKIQVVITVAVWYLKGEPSRPTFANHIEIATLLDVLSDEVRSVVNAFLK